MSWNIFDAPVYGVHVRNLTTMKEINEIKSSYNICFVRKRGGEGGSYRDAGLVLLGTSPAADGSKVLVVYDSVTGATQALAGCEVKETF